MKWGTKYGPEYVNRLYAMVRRHLSGDFNMVCLTDNSSGIRSEVQCLPIPALDLPPGIPERGWTKLASFAADLHGFIPLVGHFIGMSIVSLVSITKSPTTALIALGSYIIYVQIENYVITPKIMRNSLAIPGLVTIIAALLGTSLLGLIGGLLAVPIAAAVLLIIDEVVFPRADQS